MLFRSENEVTLEIIKKISRKLENQDKEFIKEILELVSDGQNYEQINGSIYFKKSLIKNKSGFEE